MPTESFSRYVLNGYDALGTLGTLGAERLLLNEGHLLSKAK